MSSSINLLDFESYGNDVFCVTKNDQYKIQMKLYKVQEDFLNNGFIRINKSYIINVSKIISVSPQINSQLKLTMVNKQEVYVNRTYLKAFKKFVLKGVR